MEDEVYFEEYNIGFKDEDFKNMKLEELRECQKMLKELSNNISKKIK